MKDYKCYPKINYKDINEMNYIYANMKNMNINNNKYKHKFKKNFNLIMNNYIKI